MYEQIEKVVEEATHNPEATKNLEKELESNITRIRNKLPITLETLEAQCQEDADLERSFDRMFESFCDYWISVVKLEAIKIRGLDDSEFTKELVRIDSLSHSIHNGLIVDINALAMMLKKNGRDVNWISGLRPEGRENRTLYGNFALLSVYLKLLEMGL